MASGSAGQGSKSRKGGSRGARKRVRTVISTRSAVGSIVDRAGRIGEARGVDAAISYLNSKQGKINFLTNGGRRKKEKPF